jgi:4-carboxymuconolactone decarboxylase
MSESASTAHKAFGDSAPALADYIDQVLFGDVWERPGLSPHDRSLGKALDNGLTREEPIEAITHLAFYSGWPTASTALGVARRVFAERDAA